MSPAMQSAKGGRSLADARLIAAAPELLAALERIVGEHADLGEVDLETDERDAIDQARDALAKAKGGTA